MTGLDRLSEDILLKLHDCSARHHWDTWSFESAFRVLGYENYEQDYERVFDLLIRRGYITADDRFELKVMPGEYPIRSVNDTGVTITELGKRAAVETQLSREPKTVLQRLHSLNWATWGGLAAIIAAAASSIAAYFAYLAVD